MSIYIFYIFIFTYLFNNIEKYRDQYKQCAPEIIIKPQSDLSQSFAYNHPTRRSSILLPIPNVRCYLICATSCACAAPSSDAARAAAAPAP